MCDTLRCRYRKSQVVSRFFFVCATIFTFCCCLKICHKYARTDKSFWVARMGSKRPIPAAASVSASVLAQQKLFHAANVLKLLDCALWIAIHESYNRFTAPLPLLTAVMKSQSILMKLQPETFAQTFLSSLCPAWWDRWGGGWGL